MRRDTLVDARSGKEKVVEEVKKVTRGQGADATLNVSDHESAAATGAAVTKMHGTLLCSELLFMQVILIYSRNSRTDSSANECECPISGASLSRHKNPWQSHQ
jgi:hypothetical protein